MSHQDYDKSRTNQRDSIQSSPPRSKNTYITQKEMDLVRLAKDSRQAVDFSRKNARVVPPIHSQGITSPKQYKSLEADGKLECVLNALELLICFADDIQDLHFRAPELMSYIDSQLNENDHEIEDAPEGADLAPLAQVRQQLNRRRREIKNDCDIALAVYNVLSNGAVRAHLFSIYKVVSTLQGKHGNWVYNSRFGAMQSTGIAAAASEIDTLE